MIRPQAFLSYEHMFCLPRTSTLAQRVTGALALTRSFLLLEDDCQVDWEVDRSELNRVAHPHRRALRGRETPRRPGRLPHPEQACLCAQRRGEALASTPQAAVRPRGARGRGRHAHDPASRPPR
jgi:hypothetical protein